jgi:N-acetylglutamate synthase-like GNAT family acetyltransferase
MEKPTIRLAALADWAAITACVNAAYAPYIERIGRPPAPMTADYADLIRQDWVFVLLEEGDCRGVLVLMQEETTLWIENVAVHPDHQHRGLGRRLLAYAEQLPFKPRRASFTRPECTAQHHNEALLPPGREPVINAYYSR